MRQTQPTATLSDQCRARTLLRCQDGREQTGQSLTDNEEIRHGISSGMSSAARSSIEMRLANSN